MTNFCPSDTLFRYGKYSRLSVKVKSYGRLFRQINGSVFLTKDSRKVILFGESATGLEIRKTLENRAYFLFMG